MNRLLRVTALFAALAGAVSTPLSGQVSATGDLERLGETRQDLMEMLSRYEQTATASTSSPKAKAQAQIEAEALRVRLRDGDFRPGDEVVLRVEGEPNLDGSFLVNSERAVTLPVIGAISLRGVLRSELQDHLTAQLANYLVDPVVTANSSVRIMISGSVNTPGFYVVPTEKLLSAAIMDAGGPASLADLGSIRIERSGKVVMEGEGLQAAIAQGQTVGQLSLLSGDNVVIPSRSSGGTSRLVTTVLPALLLVLTSLTQLF